MILLLKFQEIQNRAQIQNFPSFEPRKYAVALCSQNVWGVILSEAKETIKFKDGSESDCWTGVTCRTTMVTGFGAYEGKVFTKKVGDNWASKNPHVIGYLNGVENMSIDEILSLARTMIATRNL